MSVEPTPTLASLERTRRRHEASRRLLRPLALVFVLVAEVAGARTRPLPGLHGERLAVLLALVGVAVGLVGVMAVSRCRTALQIALLVLLVASSLTLFWLQPNGPGVIGVFVAVGVAALRVRPPFGVAVAVVALVAQAAAGALSGERSATSVVSSEIGVVAFYAVATLARRLGEGQEQAEQMLRELERGRDVQANAVAMAERQRLAREMHDVLAHSLSGLVVQLEGARLLASQREVDADVAGAVERAHHLAKAGLDEARRAIGMLRGDELPGPERLQLLAHQFEHDTGTPCSLEVSGAAGTLTPDARLTVYRVAQEALTNVRKHAVPARVELHLAYGPDGTRLTVEDFGGGGRAVQDDDHVGYGLTGMRERAELLGGDLVTAATGSGFKVDLWVPAQEPA